MRRAGTVAWCVVAIVATSVCSRSPRQVVLTADMPLHLEDHLDAATFTETAAPPVEKTDLPKPVEWRFDQPQPEWKASPMWHPGYRPATLARTGEGLRVTFTERTRFPDGRPAAGIHVDVPEWDRDDWAEVVIRLRAAPGTPAFGLMLGFNAREAPGATTRPLEPFEFQSEGGATVVPDGTVSTFRLRVNSGQAGQAMRDPWRQLGLWFFQWSVPWARTAESIEILSVAVVPKGAVPAPTTVEWRFDEPQPDWKLVLPNPAVRPALVPAQVARATDALRVSLPEGSRQANKLLHGGIYIDLPGWRREEWAHVIVRARTTAVTDMTVGLNPRPGVVPANAAQATFARSGGTTPIVSDGSVQTYQIRPDWGGGRIGPWLRVGFDFRASAPGSIDILSVSVVPIAALYADERVGSRSIPVTRRYWRSVFTHAPGRLEYRVRVPAGGRLDAALGVLNTPVEFRVIATAANGEVTTVLRETQSDPDEWTKRSVDLSAFAGQTITLGLETSAAAAGTVAFWGSPTLSGTRRTDKPNVIFYVIDAGGADQMSVYGYNRRTTPNLERLAREGALFEHAYSNSSWTVPSTTTFMTSLHNSVLGTGGLDVGRTQGLPAAARTMAEQFHDAGYLTAVLTSNGFGSGLERSVDTFSQAFDFGRLSSVDLARGFWDWRSEFRGEPYWVHIQTTDVHGGGPSTPVPFAGLFASPVETAQIERWNAMLRDWDTRNIARVRADAAAKEKRWVETGIDAVAYRIAFNNWERSLYDEMMAHQDHQIGRLVERLVESGQWEHTLLIVAADHSFSQGFSEFLVPLAEKQPPDWQTPILRSSESRVPLLFFWPGGIKGGQRFSQQVSLIDVLPTLLELTGLPRLEVTQGQSLAPLLLGRAGWQSRPVIFDEFEKDPSTGEVRGRIEMIDGRWGASLWIGPPKDPRDHRPMPLLLFDVWNDPLALTLMNDANPELVKKYTELLQIQWRDHQALAKQFKPGPKVALTPEQLERLRSLGYIR